MGSSGWSLSGRPAGPALAAPATRCDSPSDMRILVVEDERKVAAFIRQGLVEEGHAGAVASDGAAALDAIAEDPAYDLGVLDVMLPKPDGFDVLKTLRERRVPTPGLLLTAPGSGGGQLVGLDLGSQHYP